jgi:dihydrofolate reductase
MGSAVPIHSLLPHDLIDEYRLAIYPLLLGGGVHLFPDDGALHHRCHPRDLSTGSLRASAHEASHDGQPAALVGHPAFRWR